VAKVIERTNARYEVQEVEFGEVYKWRPGAVVVECECGERSALTASVTDCEECGEDHAGTVREESEARRRTGDEVVHPWRYARERETVSLLF
jgi:hypothetical protein